MLARDGLTRTGCWDRRKVILSALVVLGLLFVLKRLHYSG